MKEKSDQSPSLRWMLLAETILLLMVTTQSHVVHHILITQSLEGKLDGYVELLEPAKAGPTLSIKG